MTFKSAMVWIVFTKVIMENLIFVVSVILGLWMFLKPARTIEIQRKFYLKINWRIEPVSMRKEIRNTKLMGIFLIILALAGSVFYLFYFK